MADVAQACGLEIEMMDDVKSSTPGRKVAVPLIESVSNVMEMKDDGTMVYYSNAIPTNKVRGGLIYGRDPVNGPVVLYGTPSSQQGFRLDHSSLGVLGGGSFENAAHDGFPNGYGRALTVSEVMADPERKKQAQARRESNTRNFHWESVGVLNDKFMGVYKHPGKSIDQTLGRDLEWGLVELEPVLVKLAATPHMP